jgi:hypothetical protein
MTDDEAQALRTQHVEAMDLLGKAKDFYDQAEMLVATKPQSIFAHLSLTAARAALRISHYIENRSRARARQTYKS